MIVLPELHALVIIGLQVWGWLYHGVWIEVPMLSLFVPMGEFQIHIAGAIDISISQIIPVINSSFSDWLAWPQSWIGVHKIVYAILDFVPLVLVEVAAAFLLLHVASRLDERLSMNRRGAD